MKREVILRTAARREFERATEWYEFRRTGLGTEFVNSVEEVIRTIAENPERFPQGDPGIRKANLPRFPYSVYFRERPPNRIVILAVFHGRRDPETLRSR